MKMWLVRWNRDITEVEVERISDSSVWIAGRRHALKSSWERYYATWEAAYSDMLKYAEEDAAYKQDRLDQALKMLERVKAMKKG